MFITPQLVGGLTIMTVGVALLLDKLGVLHARDIFAYWPILIVLFGASMIVESLRPVDPATGVRPRRQGFPCFFLLFLLIPLLSSFFPSSRSEARASGGDDATVAGVMGSSSNTVASSNFHSGHVSSVMGRSTLDLRQVKLAPGQEAVVEVFVAMGRATIRIPDDWVVDTSAMPVMGAIEDLRWPRHADESNAQGPAPAPSPRLRLRGFVAMGKAEITS